MNLKFLGDAFDHWKGSLFDSLRAARVLHDFAVDPMASDVKSWKPEDFRLFARLLRITPAHLIPHRVPFQDRVGYFDEISHAGDLFLDPDTGVATGPVKEPDHYLYPSEIKQLLDASANRLLIIYQHVRARQVADRVDDVLRILRGQIGAFNWCTYESGTVAMVFLARTRARTTLVARHFGRILGRHASGRIRRSTSRA
jgi:hypothetical protein